MVIKRLLTAALGGPWRAAAEPLPVVGGTSFPLNQATAAVRHQQEHLYLKAARDALALLTPYCQSLRADLITGLSRLDDQVAIQLFSGADGIDLFVIRERKSASSTFARRIHLIPQAFDNDTLIKMTIKGEVEPGHFDEVPTLDELGFGLDQTSLQEIRDTLRATVWDVLSEEQRQAMNLSVWPYSYGNASQPQPPRAPVPPK